MTSLVIRCAASLSNLHAVSDAVEKFAAQFSPNAATTSHIRLALEEAFVNVCSYAYKGEAGEVEITCWKAGQTFVLQVGDWGPPFDSLSLPAPDITQGIEDRQPGGLGVHLIRALSNRVSYRREGGRNILRIEFEMA